MRKLALALLYTATTALANPAMADVQAAEALRDGDMKKLNFHSEPQDAGTAEFISFDGDPLSPAGKGAESPTAAALHQLSEQQQQQQQPPSPSAKGERKKGLTEKERRELAKQLRHITGASARLCEKALQSHADDMERAANWLLEQKSIDSGVEG